MNTIESNILHTEPFQQSDKETKGRDSINSTATSKSHNKLKQNSQVGHDKHRQSGFNAKRHAAMLSLRDSLSKEYDNFKIKYSNGVSFSLFEKRLQDVNVRGYYAKLVYDYITNNKKYIVENKRERLFTEIIPFILEAVITIQYYHNQVLDGKAGKADMDMALKNIEAANKLKPALYDYIENEITNKRDVAILKHYVSEMFYYVDFGQYVEKTGNRISGYIRNKGYNWVDELEKLIKSAYWLPSPLSYCNSGECIYSLEFQTSLLAENIRLQRNFHESSLTGRPSVRSHKFSKSIISSSTAINELIHSLPSDHAWFAELYFKRISLTCGALFVRATQMILQLIGVSESEKEARELMAFSKCFGVMRQVVNDNVDWAPSYLGLCTKTKDAEDAFSDLKNGNITLPLIFHLQNSNKSIIHDYLEGEVSINKEIEKSFFHSIISSGALKTSMRIGRAIADEAISFLDKSNPASTNFIDMSGIAFNNKYYHHFYRANREFEKLGLLISLHFTPYFPYLPYTVSHIAPLSKYGKELYELVNLELEKVLKYFSIAISCVSSYLKNKLLFHKTYLEI